MKTCSYCKFSEWNRDEKIVPSIHFCRNSLSSNFGNPMAWCSTCELFEQKDIKQVIVIRKDLNMRRGKAETQACHASMKVFFDRARILWEVGSCRMDIPLTNEMGEWASGIFKKISLSCNSEEELVELYSLAIEAGLPCAMVVDSGQTEFHGEPTKTCIAIGPAMSEQIDKITGHLILR